jgi:hypothetical protein
MSLFKQLAGETVVYGFSHMLGKVLNYVLIAFYLTRKLSNQQAEYGIYNELYFYVALLLILFGLRMETTFFRFGSEQESYKKAFSNGLASMTGLALIWLVPAFIFSDQIAQLLSYPDKGIYIRILSALIATDLIIAMPMARFRLDRRPCALHCFKQEVSFSISRWFSFSLRCVRQWVGRDCFMKEIFW